MSYVCTMFPDNRIREWRKKAKLTQAELGELVGLHQTQIGNLENGGRNLTLDWARRIARVLNVTVADLLDDKDNPDRLSDEERALIHDFRAADEQQQAMIRRVAEPLQSFTPEPVNDGDGRLKPRKVA